MALHCECRKWNCLRLNSWCGLRIWPVVNSLSSRLREKYKFWRTSCIQKTHPTCSYVFWLPSRRQAQEHTLSMSVTGIEYIYISNITCRRDIHIIYILAEPLDHPFNPRLLFLNNPRLALHSCEPISTHIILRLYGHFTHSRYHSLIFGLIWCHRANLQLHLIWIVSACSLILWTILNPGILRFADLIFQKCSRTLSFF